MTALAHRLPAFALLAAFPVMLSAQAPTQTAPPTSVPAGPASASDVSSPPSQLLAPAVGQIRQALTTLRPEKWKAPGPVAKETASNVNSIERDLDNTLPGLLATADRNPASVADVLPAYRNIEALYDVLLRVTEISKLSAPAQQSTALQQATASLDDARRSLGERMQIASAAQNHAISTLQAQLRAAQSSTSAQTSAPPPCPPAAPPTRRRTPSKAKPAAPSTAPATH